MAGRRIRTVLRDGTWWNELEGAEHAASEHPSKEEAVRRGRELARNAHMEHVIEDDELPEEP